MAELKSLAHPEWPYTGTVHEWRGFVKDKAEQESWDDQLKRRDAIWQKQYFGPYLK